MAEKQFMIKSVVLEKLKPEINKAVSFITQAIEAKRPIWIRHHSDTDGYCAALALERAILPLVYNRQAKERDVFYYYSRLPSKSPYYDYVDATKDLTNFMNNVNRFEIKPPLIIICDNGSSDQSIAAIKKVRIYGAKLIVFDHHPPSHEITKIVEAHVNPHFAGSTYDISAGMLCAEIAKQINPEIDQMEFFAAVAGVGDKVESREMEEYLKLCHKNYSLEFIKDVAMCLDYEAYVLGYIESRDLVNDILGADPAKQKKLIEFIKPQIKELVKQQLETNKRYMQIEEKEKLVVCKLDIENTKMFTFPPSGKTTGITQDYLIEKYKKPVISLGISNDQINIRCSRELKKFDVNEIMNLLKENLPYAQVNGGGHRTAGSISFVEAAKEEVFNIVEEYIEKL